MIEKNYSENFERDLEKIYKNIKESENLKFEKKEENQDIKKVEEIERNSIKSAIKNINVKQTATEKIVNSLRDLFPSYLKKDTTVNEEVKIIIEKLINLALKEGIEKAIKESLKYSSFIQDAFHDALVDKIFPYLKQKEKENI